MSCFLNHHYSESLGIFHMNTIKGVHLSILQMEMVSVVSIDINYKTARVVRAALCCAQHSFSVLFGKGVVAH